MRITEVQAWKETIPLARPYAIAFKDVSAVALHYVRIVTDVGVEGLGSAAPTDITGETSQACVSALVDTAPALLTGRDPRRLRPVTRMLREHLRGAPGACAALDMALYDLLARAIGLPLVDVLGRRHDALPTSITIGIKSLEETLGEAEEYVGRGFRCLKVKLGREFEEDIGRLRRLREYVGDHVRIRVDANQGYTLEQARRIGELATDLDLELVEQPLPAHAAGVMRELSPEMRAMMAADESLHTATDAFRLTREPMPFGIFNIKLMKCGGITGALAIADVAELAGLRLMWGCMDESVISIAAALHAAYACPATRFLDLDGSFDLSRDVATGGFSLREGRLHVANEPGLGVRLQ